MMELRRDPKRAEYRHATGMYVEADLARDSERPPLLGMVNVGELDTRSLVAFIAGDRREDFAILAIGLFLGHRGEDLERAIANKGRPENVPNFVEADDRARAGRRKMREIVESIAYGYGGNAPSYVREWRQMLELTIEEAIEEGIRIGLVKAFNLAIAAQRKAKADARKKAARKRARAKR